MLSVALMGHNDEIHLSLNVNYKSKISKLFNRNKLANVEDF